MCVEGEFFCLLRAYLLLMVCEGELFAGVGLALVYDVEGFDDCGVFLVEVDEIVFHLACVVDDSSVDGATE